MPERIGSAVAVAIHRTLGNAFWAIVLMAVAAGYFVPVLLVLGLFAPTAGDGQKAACALALASINATFYSAVWRLKARADRRGAAASG